MLVADRTHIRDAFEAGLLAHNVQMGPDNRSLVLYDLTLVEDDGPGACSIHEHGASAPTTIRGDTQVKKILYLDRAEARSACLALCAGPLAGETAPLETTLNGRTFTCDVDSCSGGALDWPAIRIPAALLKRGENDVVLSCRGQKGWRVSAALRRYILRNDPERHDRPERSFRSTDGGATWTPGLGDDGGDDGELMVRLQLCQYAPRGHLIGPVIDLAALAADASSMAADVEIRWMRVRARKKLRAGTKIELSCRTGPKPLYDPDTWSDWKPCEPYVRLPADPGRFVQWRAVLTTTKPKTTPVLEAVELEARVDPQPHRWAAKLELTESHNEEIRHTSIPFEYEKSDEPQLVELRRRYRLDDVVRGAQSEMEMMVKLRNWVSAQWRYDPPLLHYPAWDAREILHLRRGFCVQYAIVYMQCALSLGMQTRFVFGRFPNVSVNDNWVCGHEVTEYWSNDLGKWVMMDAHQDECFVDSRTGIPCSMLELHEDQLNTYFPNGINGSGARFDDELPSDGLLCWKAADPSPSSAQPKLPVKWGYLHWMPRNNFYAHRFPEPLHQGRSWTWTGYWLWHDDRTPRQCHFGRYTQRRSDIEWTINQVRWAAAPDEREGTIRLAMCTVTPDFDTFLVSIDGCEWLPSADTFDWRLHPGSNRLEMRIRNRAGVLGRPSSLAVRYRPPRPRSIRHPQ